MTNCRKGIRTGSDKEWAKGWDTSCGIVVVEEAAIREEGQWGVT